jgi:two-component system OmpR family sensor kinase
MSSSRLASRITARWPLPAGMTARWSLRTRLIAALVGLLAVACLVVSGVTQVAMHQFQVRQLDIQLSEASRLAGIPRPGSNRPPVGSDRGRASPFDGRGQQPGTLFVHLVDGSVDETRSGVLDSDAAPQALTASQEALVTQLPVDNRPYTRNLGSLHDYRLVAFQAADGDVVITGLSMRQVDEAGYRLAAIETIVSLGVLALAALLGTLIVRRTLRPLDRVAATARRVAELPLDRGEVALSVRVPDHDTDPRTEVGQVGAALNRMLGHVAKALAARQASETRVRHFVADASHELRTPLAAIRGYAELTRRVGDGVPPDVAHAMRRVESEAARMTTLVEDLLLLARLDAGRPLATDEVDLSRLAIDAVSDAHIAGPGHRWQLDLPEESVTVTGDAARLHQVLANLLANARTHTPAGTVVTTSLRTGPDHAELSVLDNGPGIPPALLPEVFERFARGDSSRSRAAGSTGLGLAIVAAVTEAHAGRVEVASEPGRTVFTVRLPVVAASPAGTWAAGERVPSR